MKTDSPSPARGVYAALATPRVRDSIEADPAALFDYLDAAVCGRVDGIVLFGSTGEFVHFDVADRIHVTNLASKRCRAPLLVNVSHSTLVGALDLADNAVDAGVSGLLLMPPYFFRYTEEQIFSFYSKFASIIGGKLPLYLYNIPMFTNAISADLAARLLATGAFSGIKDSSGDWNFLEGLLAVRAKSPFQLLVGSDGLYQRAVPLGADGVVSGVAAAVPELMVSLDRALRVRDAPRAARLQHRLEEFLGWVTKFPATVIVKRAATARGWKLDHSSIPFDSHTTAELTAFDNWFREWLPGALADSA